MWTERGEHYDRPLVDMWWRISQSPIHRKIATLLEKVLVYLLSRLSESMLESWSAIDFDYFDYFSQWFLSSSGSVSTWATEELLIYDLQVWDMDQHLGL